MILGITFNEDLDLSKRLVSKSWRNSFLDLSFCMMIEYPKAALKMGYFYCLCENATLFSKIFILLNKSAVEYLATFINKIICSSSLNPFHFTVASIPLAQRRDSWERLLQVYKDKSENLGEEGRRIFDAVISRNNYMMNSSILLYSKQKSFANNGDKVEEITLFDTGNGLATPDYNHALIKCFCKVIMWASEIGRDDSDWIYSLLQKACYLLDQDIMDLLKLYTNYRACAKVEWVFYDHGYEEEPINFISENHSMFDFDLDTIEPILGHFAEDKANRVLPEILKHRGFEGLSDLEILKHLCKHRYRNIVTAFIQLKLNGAAEMIWWLVKWIIVKEDWHFIPLKYLESFIDSISEKLPRLISKMVLLQTNKVVPFFRYTKYRIKNEEITKKALKRCQKLPQFAVILPQLNDLQVFGDVNINKRRRV